MNAWERASEPVEQKIGWRKITSKTFIRPDGAEAEYTTYGGIDDRHGAVIALTPENLVVTAEQFRPGPEMIMQEIPGGNIEIGENSQDAVMRELREESGYTSDEVFYLGELRKDGYMNATWHYYLARNCYKTESQDLDDGEFVDEKLISIAALIKNAKEGRMSDANAVLMAYDQLKEIQAGS